MTLALFAAALAGCAAVLGSGASSAPPPPAFAEMRPQEIQTVMGQLAQHMLAVDEIMRAGPEAAALSRDELWALLDQMGRVLDELDPQTLDSDHPRFGWRLRALRNDVRLAKVAVGATPPEYYLVGTVTGSCTYCHEARR